MPEQPDPETDLLAQVMNLQAGMQAAQAEINASTVTGSAGGGLVQVELSGSGTEAVSVTIAREALEAIDELEDLVVAAINDALRRSAELTRDRLAQATGGLDLGSFFGGGTP
jgi:nucleoid-associated protein EbfC